MAGFVLIFVGLALATTGLLGHRTAERRWKNPLSSRPQDRMYAAVRAM